MGRTYASTESSLRPVELTNETYAHIGRLVRAFAEIEDLITLFLCNLAEMSESHAVVLLGKTATTRRLEMAEYLAAMHGGDAPALHKHVFNEAFRDTQECRNAVAHGVLLGVTEEGKLAFLTSKTEPPTANSAIQIVMSYSLEQIRDFAQQAERAIPLIEQLLKLEAPRKMRLQKNLLPHRKGRPGARPSAGTPARR